MYLQIDVVFTRNNLRRNIGPRKNPGIKMFLVSYQCNGDRKR